MALPLLLLLTGGGDPGLHAGRLAVTVAMDGRDDGDGVGAERRRRRRRRRRRAAGAAARPAKVAACGRIQGVPERCRKEGGALLLVSRGLLTLPPHLEAVERRREVSQLPVGGGAKALPESWTVRALLHLCTFKSEDSKTNVTSCRPGGNREFTLELLIEQLLDRTGSGLKCR